jgi:DNA-directed RNA polymerase III subunit RPC3
MSNLIQRHQFERERHRKLIDKRDKVDAIIHSLREQNADEEQIKEVEDILIPVEKEQIQKLDAAFRKYEIERFYSIYSMRNYFLGLNLLNFN